MPPKLKIVNDVLEKAEEALSSINFSDYKAQVISFLEPHCQETFGHKDYWKTLSNTVLRYLNGLKK